MNRVNQVVNRVVNREIIATIATIGGVHNFDFEIFGGARTVSYGTMLQNE